MKGMCVWCECDLGLMGRFNRHRDINCTDLVHRLERIKNVYPDIHISVKR